MANALAIAGVTAVLKDLLNDGLINANVDSIGQFSVTSVPPDQLDPANGDRQINRLNIYMWHARRNAAWSNERFPSRNTNGQRIDSPYLALDLYYLLTATGDAELNAEILFGFGMQVLHETPVLARDAIRTALTNTNVVDASLLPAAQQFLQASDLADQFEQLRISPVTLDSEKPMELEGVSNLWSAFSAPLRASAVYRISCVLIESRTPVRSTLPVLTIGGRTALIRSPQITRMRALPNGPQGQSDGVAPVLPGSWISIEGTALAAEQTRVTLRGQPVAVNTANVANGRIAMQLPADIEAGAGAVQIEHLFTPEGGGASRLWELSNTMVLIITPVFSAANVAGASGPNGFSGTVTTTLGHTVGVDQTAALLLNPLPGGTEDAISVRCDNRTSDGTQVTVQLRNVTPGSYLIRIEIDGAPTELTMRATGFDGPVVVLP